MVMRQGKSRCLFPLRYAEVAIGARPAAQALPAGFAHRRATSCRAPQLRSHPYQRNLTMQGRIRAWVIASSLIAWHLTASATSAQRIPADRDAGPPTIVVSGQAEVSARPDRAVVRLGAVAQAEQASAAQRQVNEAVGLAIDEIRTLGIADEQISTAAIDLSPVYAQSPDRPVEEPIERRIVAYRASNVLSIELNNLKQIGDVIDAAVAAGVNRIDSVSFELRDDTALRQRALRQAVQEARAEAQAMAEALDVQIEGVADAFEGNVHIMQPRLALARSALAEDAGTPIRPGQVNVSASVTVHYRISNTSTSATEQRTRPRRRGTGADEILNRPRFPNTPGESNEL